MSKQIANTATTTSANKVPLSAEALEAKKQAERTARRVAHRQKRSAKLAEVKKNDPLRVPCILNFNEYKAAVALRDTALVGDSAVSTWAAFCLFKAAAYAEYWTAKAKKPAISEKSIARKQAKFVAAKEKLAKMQAELEALVAADSK
jgi:hypothetical protein